MEELQKIYTSYGHTGGINDLNILKRRVESPFRKHYTAKEAFEVNRSDFREVLLEILQLDNLYEGLQLQGRLAPEERVLVDQPIFDNLPLEEFDQVYQQVSKEVIDPRFRSLTFQQMRQLLPENLNSRSLQTRQQIDDLLQNIEKLSSSLFILSRDQYPVSYLGDYEIGPSEVFIIILLNMLKYPGKERHPKVVPGEQFQRHWIESSMHGQIPDDLWTYPIDTETEILDLATRRTNYRVTFTALLARKYFDDAKKTSYQFSPRDYEMLREFPRDLLRRILAAKMSVPWTVSALMTQSTLMYMLIHQRYPEGWTEQTLPDRLNQFNQKYRHSGYWLELERAFKSYYQTDDLLDLINLRHQKISEVFDHLIGKSFERITAMRKYQMVPWMLFPDLAIAGLRQLYHARGMVERVNSGISSEDPRRLTDTELLQSVGLQPVYYNRDELLDKLESESIFYVLDPNICEELVVVGQIGQTMTCYSIDSSEIPPQFSNDLAIIRSILDKLNL